MKPHKVKFMEISLSHKMFTSDATRKHVYVWKLEIARVFYLVVLGEKCVGQDGGGTVFTIFNV
jgi:hypothetical protein